MDERNPTRRPPAVTCVATSKRSGQRCRRAPAKGAAVCATHGGKAPQVRRAARERVVEERARAELYRMGRPAPVHNPIEELADLAGEIVAWKNKCAQHVAALAEQLTYWTDREWHKAEGVPIHTEAVENLRAVVSAYERGLDRTVRVLATIAKLNLEERMVKIRQTELDVIVAAIRAAGAAIGLQPPAQRALEAAMAENLASVTVAEQPAITGPEAQP